MRSGIVIFVLLLIVGCSAQTIPTSQLSQTHNIQPMCDGCNPGGTSGGNNGPTPSPSPSGPVNIGTVVATASIPNDPCDASKMYCDGPLFVQCIRACTPLNGYIAVYPAQLRDDCWSSPGKIGNNLPANTTGPTTEITNIAAVWSPTLAGTGRRQVMGWIYTTRNGAQFWEMDKDYTGSFLDTPVTNFPLTAPFAQFLKDNMQGVSPISSTDASNFQQDVKSGGGFTASCFSTPLG